VPNKPTTTTTVSTFFKGHSHQDIQAVGLSFEPNFFVKWLYADKYGEQCAGLQRFTRNELKPDDLLWQPDQVQAIYGLVHNEAFTLMPSALFDENEARKYLALNHNISEHIAVDWDDIPEAGITLIYQDVQGVQSMVDHSYPGLKVRHGMGHIIRLMLRASKNQSSHSYIYGCDNLYYVVVYKNNGLQLANAISAQHVDDMVYFYLYTMKQLAMPHNCPLTLLGNAPDLHKLQLQLEQYVPSVKVGFNPKLIQIDAAIEAEALATHFIGYTGQLCA
jgi:hypothetical protein